MGPETEELIVAAAEELMRAAGCSAEIDLRLPKIMGVWGATGGVGIRISLGDRWPECAPGLGGLERAGQRAADTGFTIDAMARPKAAEPSSTVPWR